MPPGAEPQAPRPERGSPPRLLRGGKVPGRVSACEHPPCLQGIKPRPSEAGTAKQSQTPAVPSPEEECFCPQQEGQRWFSSPAPGGEHSEPSGAAPIPHHPALPAQALPLASSSSPSTISRGLLVPARIIAYNYSCWATNSEASLRRIATPSLIPLGNPQLIAADSEEAASHLPTQPPGATRAPSLPRGKLGSWRLPLGRGPPQGTKHCPSKKQQRPHTLCSHLS